MLLLGTLSACGDGAVPLERIQLSERDAHAVAVDAEGAETAVCTSDGDERTAELDGKGYIRGLLAETTYSCVAGDYAATLTTPPLPDDLALGELAVPDEEAGWHLVNLSRLERQEDGSEELVAPYLVVLDARGRPRWQYAGVGAGDLDVTWLGGGQLSFGGITGVPPTVMDLDGRVSFRARQAQYTDHQQKEGWSHDAGFDQADPARLWAYATERVPDDDGAWVGFVLLGIDADSGAADFAWASSEHLDELPSRDLSNEDRFHANSIWDVTEDDGESLYLGLRRQSTVEKLDLETGTIAWSLGYEGDFALLEGDGSPAGLERWFYGQHDVKRTGDRLTMFDNGVLRPDAAGADRTRVLELALDEEARTARIAFEWTLPTTGEPWVAFQCGGVDLRDDGYCAASSWLADDYPGNEPTQLLHVSTEGEVTWQLTFEEGVSLYRSEEVATFP